MISPLSISLALSMTYNGAEGDTKLAMEETMEMTGLAREEINSINKQLVTALINHDPSVTLEIANSIWYRDEYSILPDFITRNETYYDAQVRALDFADPGTVDVINGWVAEKTHDKIDKIVEQISPESFMFLINAIYYKGNWRYEFDPKETSDRSFFLEDGTVVDVPMMSAELDVNLFRNELFTALELPYGKGNWSMVFFLPNWEHRVDEIMEELSEENWNTWLGSLSPQTEVDVAIPKFTFEYEKSLKDVLMALGMEVAFTTAADFTGILPGGQLLISDVKHKTFVEVNEEGTEAAAVTSVEIELTSIGNGFTANKPFLFFIVERSSGTILFSGKLMNPKN